MRKMKSEKGVDLVKEVWGFSINKRNNLIAKTGYYADCKKEN